MNSKNKVQEIKGKFKNLFEFKDKEKKIKHDEYLLMAKFLSEIESVQKKREMNRKQLAELIQLTPSYLTQVFRGDKPLNFHTLAKIQHELDIHFNIVARYNNSIIDNCFNAPSSDEVTLPGLVAHYPESKFAFLSAEMTTVATSSNKIPSSETRIKIGT